jgi:hypothetical protein
MTRIKILVLTANPSDAGVEPLDLDAEVRQIEEAIRRSPRRDHFQIVARLALRTKDLRHALLEHRPQIVHFCGHGTENKGLVLENDTGKMQEVSTEGLGRLFGAFDENTIQCVLLNACYSEVQAKAILQFVDCVIGMNQPISDQAAIQFAEGFYDALGAGSTYGEAFKIGCNAIDLDGNSEYLTPQLIGGKRGRAISPVAQGAPEPEATPAQIPAPVPPAPSQSFGNVTISGSNNPVAQVNAGGNATVSQDNSRQSMTISGSNISGQVGQGKHVHQTQTQSAGESAKQLSPAEVVELITQIQNLLRSSSLPDSQQGKAVSYLEAAKEEASSEEPDKDFAAKSLQKATKILKETNDAVETGQSLWSKVAPLLGRLLPWLGVAASFLSL